MDMQEESRRQIALFRYGLIAPMVRQTEAGCQKAMLEALAKMVDSETDRPRSFNRFNTCSCESVPANSAVAISCTTIDTR